MNGMLKIRLSGHLLLDLDDAPIPGAEFGKMISEALAASQSGNPVKCYDLARRFRKGRDIELDRSDFDLVHSEVQGARMYPALTKAQLLTFLDDEKKWNEEQDHKAEAKARK